MIVRDHLIEVELVEELSLIPTAPTHHLRPHYESRMETESRSPPLFNSFLQQ
jgi:hypothetical protein